MGIFDKIKEMAHGSKGKEMSDTAEREANKRTGDKYTGQVDQAQQQMEERLGIDDDPNK
jgi:hypothetical protein